MKMKYKHIKMIAYYKLSISKVRTDNTIYHILKDDVLFFLKLKVHYFYKQMIFCTLM